ncbi:hypothetical protein [Tepidimonas sp.]|uniref:hypothetical protein n=1 Tax=Tepidimonas sp. TaxID=2002775 RepID=UPI002FE028AD
MGSPASTPQEIAREAVKLLTARRLPPTPDNFQAAYHEVAGTRPLQPFPLAQLRQIAQALPDRTPAQVRFKALFNKAVSRHSWDDLEKLLTQNPLAGAAPAAAPEPATPSAPPPPSQVPRGPCCRPSWPNRPRA